MPASSRSASIRTRDRLHPGSVLTSMIKRVDRRGLSRLQDGARRHLEAGRRSRSASPRTASAMSLDADNAALITPEMKAKVEAARGRHHRRPDQGSTDVHGAMTAPAVELRHIAKSFGAVAAVPRRVARPGARLDPRHRRRERRRQVDADEHPLRPLSPRCRRDPRRRRDGALAQPGRRHRARHRHGPPAFHAGRALHRARQSAARAGGRRASRRGDGEGARALAAFRRGIRPRRRSRRPRRGSAGRAAAARRDHQGAAIAAPRS